MTLRLRLVGALVLFTAVGLTLFGVTTYQLYADAQYDELDEQLLSSRANAARTLTFVLAEGGSLNPGGELPQEPTADGQPGESLPDRPPIELQATYAELRNAQGQLIVSYPEGLAGPDRPDLAGAVTHPGNTADLFTAHSGAGDVGWRVLVAPLDGSPHVVDEYFIVVATPITEVERGLDRLLLIEGTAAAGLLAALALGAWLIIRRGLRPLEQMAGTAQQITEGDLSQRVTPDDPDSEVGRLGLALNTMLDEVQASFGRRDETERQLRQFLADAAHELRTPLTSIRGFAELFRLRPELTDATELDEPRATAPGENQPQSAQLDQAVMLRRIEQESERMGKLIDDLLLLTHLDRRRAPQRTEVDLAVLAADTCSDAAARDPDRPINLHAPEPVIVDGDPDHLRQAIGNLMTNALRHTPAGTPVEVRATKDGDDAIVQVRDHGHGLSGQALTHMFDRFWQADSSRSSQGVGLGLSIVASIASEHDGHAEATNAPDGDGAVFTFRLPRGTPAAIDAPGGQ